MSWKEKILFPFQHHRWARRIIGGKWELWWADPCTAYVWLKRDEFTPLGKRPGGCAIWEEKPAPLAREDYT